MDAVEVGLGSSISTPGGVLSLAGMADAVIESEDEGDEWLRGVSIVGVTG